MKKLICIIVAMLTISPFSLHCQDSIFLNGTNKVTFKLKNQATFYFIDCVQRSASANTTTTVTSISGVGKILLKKDGTGTFQPTSTSYTAVWKYSLAGCGYDNFTIWVGKKPVPVVVVPPSTIPASSVPTYHWYGHLGNTSKLDYGPGKFKGLRSPTGVTECNGYLYFPKGFVEGNSSISKTLISDPTTNIEVDKPLNNDFVFEGVEIASDGKRLYLLGFDPHGYMVNEGYSSKIDCGVIVYENDVQVSLSSGKSIKCTYQSTAYKSVIGLVQNNTAARPVGIDVDDKYIYIYTSTQKKTLDKTSGALLSSVSYTRSNIDSYTRGGNTIIMTDQQVTYNGRIIAKAQSSPKVDFYTYNPKDFNTYEKKGSVYIGEDGTLWVIDAGNSRILHYTATGIFINQISFLPMNYNAAVCSNDPSRVFATGIEYKVSYPDMKWEQVANWTFGLSSAYLVRENTLNFLRCTHTVNGETYGLIDSCYKDDGQDIRVPCKVKLTASGLKVLKKYEMFASVSFDAMGNEYVWESSRTSGETAILYKNGAKSQSVIITTASALNIDNAFVNVTDDGYLVVFNPNKDHSGYHLSWVKDGKIVFNAMPSVTGSGQKYPEGDAFEIGQSIEYAGGHEVYIVGKKVFVKIIGEFFGGPGGQTNLFFVYENGKLLTRGGVTSWQTTGETPKELAGNSFSGGVFQIGSDYYYIYNCEWSGALGCFKITGL